MRRLIPAITIAWAACFVYLGIVSRVPEPAVVRINDTVEGLGHFLGALVLAALVTEWIHGRSRLSNVQAAIVGGAISVALALILEALQLTRPSRSVQSIDIALDIVGAITGVLAFLSLRRLHLTRSAATRVVGWVGIVAVGLAVITFITAVLADPASGNNGLACRNEPPRTLPASAEGGDGDRVDRGLLVEYRFDEGSGTIVHDRSGTESPLDLIIGPGVEWLTDGPGIRFSVNGVARSEMPATRIAASIAKSRGFTAEAWAAPRGEQEGPARIVSISDGAQLSQIDLQIGQDGECLGYRIRQSQRGDAESDLVEAVFAGSETRYLVVAYRDGEIHSYVNGIEADTRRAQGTAPAGWIPEAPLLIGNETTQDRPFSGDVFMVALYDRALSADEIASSFAAGSRPPSL